MDTQIDETKNWDEKQLALLNLVNPALVKKHGIMQFTWEDGGLSYCCNLPLQTIAETLKTAEITCQTDFNSNPDGSVTLPIVAKGKISAIILTSGGSYIHFRKSKKTVPA